MTDRILTLHPDPQKQGVRISKVKYEVMRGAILDVLREAGPQTFEGLNAAVQARLADSFDGSISWYLTTVKLDLEARGEVEREPQSRPQKVQLAI